MTVSFAFVWCLIGYQVWPALLAPATWPRGAGSTVQPFNSSTVPPPFELRDGDRVVFVGNTFIERDQQQGYLETLLTSRYPDRNITFRNLGWSGDTVFGHARAGFDATPDGFRRLVEHVESLKPTVLFVGYGMNESFEGERGLPEFERGLRTLLDALGKTKARVVLISPIRHEDVGRPFPNPEERNRDLARYCEVLAKVAAERDCRYVDLLSPIHDDAGNAVSRQLTDNGIHPTAYGYWRLATAIERSLGLGPRGWSVTVRGAADPIAVAVRVTRCERLDRGVRLEVLEQILPTPPAPAGSPPPTSIDSREIRLRGLPPGSYRLLVDGKEAGSLIRVAKDEPVAVPVPPGPEIGQVELLRRLIRTKNETYFYRWRPQNETYLFGFRKHEQGQNAVEIPKFDPLVAKLEAEIARLRVPVPHSFEFVRNASKGK